MTVFVAVVLGGGLLALLWASARAREICVLSVRRGQVLVMRGALPSSLLEALADVVERQRTARGAIRVLRDGERPRLECQGLDEYAEQRARNVLGTYPLPRLLTARPPRTRNLGQRLGVPWLGWRIHDAKRRRAAGADSA